MGKTRRTSEDVTAEIIARIEETGLMPWDRPWIGGISIPRNPVTGKDYKGLNVLRLWASNHEIPLWAGYKQWASKGAQVQKGEKGTLIIAFKIYDRVDKATGEKTGKKGFMVRVLHVWNIAQTDADPADFGWNPERVVDTFEAHAEADAILSGYIENDGPSYEEIPGGGRAFYRPGTDEIKMPAREQFKTPEAFYGVAFHEAAHSTGHETRLGRDLSGFKGDHKYSKEELVAELTAAFLQAEIGLDTDHERENAAAYVKSWLKVLKGDPKMVSEAAGQAQKAAEYIKAKAGAERVVDAPAT